jgi:hypothetical protein
MYEEDERGFDCPSECADRECHFTHELPDGRTVSISCRGTCQGRCAGRFDCAGDCGLAAPSPARPDRRSRMTARTRQLYVEPGAGSNDEQFEVSCAVGCFVGHAAAATGGQADCYGSCLGICYGVASVRELTVPGAHERKG